MVDGQHPSEPPGNISDYQIRMGAGVGISPIQTSLLAPSASPSCTHARRSHRVALMQIALGGELRLLLVMLPSASSRRIQLVPASPSGAARTTASRMSPVMIPEYSRSGPNNGVRPTTSTVPAIGPHVDAMPPRTIASRTLIDSVVETLSGEMNC